VSGTVEFVLVKVDREALAAYLAHAEAR